MSGVFRLHPRAPREPHVRKSRAATAATSAVVPSPSPAIVLTDEQMVRRILDGEGALFEELVKRHQRQIVNFIYRMVGDFDLAQASGLRFTRQPAQAHSCGGTK